MGSPTDSSLSTSRSSWWSITINNPTEDDRLRLSEGHLPPFVKKVKFQDELGGKQNTLHIQAAANTAQVRFAAVKQWLPRAHIEPCRRNPYALTNYVGKKDTAVPGTQKEVIGDFVTMESALQMIANTVDKDDLANYMRNLKTVKQIKEKYVDLFWGGARAILKNRPGLVGLLSNPQLERAWVNTASVWIEKSSVQYLEADGQACVGEEANEQSE